jgi:hypothetical protein
MGDNSPPLTSTLPLAHHRLTRSVCEVERARSAGWVPTLLVVIVLILLWVKWRWPSPAAPRAHPNAKATARPLKSRTPDDCPACRAAQPGLTPASIALKPYSQIKSPRGRSKRVATAGYACPNSDCLYFGITDGQIHALVGYGGHPVVCHLPQRLWAWGCTGNPRASGGRQEYIRASRLKCRACRTKFSVRHGTVLYRLKTPSRRVGEVLTALAEALSVGAAVRVFGHCEFTIRTRFASPVLGCAPLHYTRGYSKPHPSSGQRARRHRPGRLAA